MKVVMSILMASLLLVVGCGSGVPSLEKEIATLPTDEWNSMWEPGPASNNYALLSRVIALTNVTERILLTRCLRDHFRRPPEWVVTNGLVHYERREESRDKFIRHCSYRLIVGENVTAETMSAGWRMESEYLNDLERMMDFTQGVWNGGVYKSNQPEAYQRSYYVASLVRRKYELYFRYWFCACAENYYTLPVSERPAFVQQIKRDFFGRKGMVFVEMKCIPMAFKE